MEETNSTDEGLEAADFDAADVADAILGANDPNWIPVAVVDPSITAEQPAAAAAADRSPPRRPAQQPSGRGNFLGWTLGVFLFFAVAIAISLAVQLDTDARPPRVTPPACGGLYQDCCDTWDDNWGPCYDDRDDCEPRPNDGGLFDAEGRFAGEDDCR